MCMAEQQCATGGAAARGGAAAGATCHESCASFHGPQLAGEWAAAGATRSATLHPLLQLLQPLLLPPRLLSLHPAPCTASREQARCAGAIYRPRTFETGGAARRELAVSSPRPACSFDAMPLPPTASGLGSTRKTQPTAHVSVTPKKLSLSSASVSMCGQRRGRPSMSCATSTEGTSSRCVWTTKVCKKRWAERQGPGVGWRVQHRVWIGGAASGVDRGRSIGCGCASSTAGTTKV